MRRPSIHYPYDLSRSPYLGKKKTRSVASRQNLEIVGNLVAAPSSVERIVTGRGRKARFLVIEDPLRARTLIRRSRWYEGFASSSFSSSGW